MPMGLASSPGWFQSVILRVCEGLERVRLFIGDIVCFSKNGCEHASDLQKNFDRLATFNLKLAPKRIASRGESDQAFGSQSNGRRDRAGSRNGRGSHEIADAYERQPATLTLGEAEV